MLFTTTGSAGHLGPLVPFADAARLRGADVLVATRASAAAQARAAGFAVRPFADAPAAQRTAVMTALRGLPVDEANARAATDLFGGIDADAAIPGMRATVGDWRPDVVVSEPSEAAGPLVAADLGVPAVTVGITQYAVEQRFERELAGARARLREAHGLGGEHGAAARFTLMPPLLDPAPAGIHRFREPARTPTTAWAGTRPLVYVTFGSVAPQRDDLFPVLYRPAIEALAGLPVRVLVTIGRHRAPAELGALPANVRVERWIPQADVIGHAAVVVCHGGSGTVRGALAAGVPLVIRPVFADQPDNARRIVELGAGLAPGAGEIGAAVREVLGDPRYARAAAAVAADIRALPPVDAAADVLRELS